MTERCREALEDANVAFLKFCHRNNLDTGTPDLQFAFEMGFIDGYLIGAKKETAIALEFVKKAILERTQNEQAEDGS